MKGVADRTKVVLRHLPPTITPAMLVDQFDDRFANRYKFISFRPGNNSAKHQIYSRAYIDFQKPEDVIEFADFFRGHVFVNEKGTQFKTVVEYAPSQRVAKHLSKKDGREGTIYKDPVYMEFLESITKPIENLPSAEIQLERREAERVGAAKDSPIVTPLMQFVRQKRAAKGGSRRFLSNGKPARTGGISSGTSGSVRRGSEKKKYIIRDTAKSSSGKEKSAYIMVPKRNDQQIPDKVIAVAASGTEILGEASGVPGITEVGKKKILLLKGREKEISHASVDLSLKETIPSPVRNSTGVTALKQNNQREAGGKIIRSILLNKDLRQNTSMLQSNTHNQEKDKRVPHPPKGQTLHDTNGDNTVTTEKQDRRTRNKGRPDRGVWTALRRSDGSHASNESLPSANSMRTQVLVDPAEGGQRDSKKDMLNSKSGELRNIGSGRHVSFENGSYKHGGRRGPQPNGRVTDGSLNIGERKPSKKGSSSGFGLHEKQVWVQKSSSGS
ncbi:Regulator of nonsense transcripts like [Heracleum sosnowskyi]|uniref:Regulator of nonsense transcripts like n=1 Tax=Heracleum sosnowskyi TaxID=360622 RepID=A0AAD8HXC3_9APIA|nr:Regulator of nonsense transcripts like [Heracleum sosnowskyi]